MLVTHKVGRRARTRTRDLAVFVDETLAELTNSMATLTGRVDDMEKHLKELESTEDFEELRGKMRAAINSVVVNVNQEVQALRASEVAQEERKSCRAEMEAYKTRVEALEAQLKVRMAMVANMGGSGSSQVSPPPDGKCTPNPSLQWGEECKRN